MKNRYEMEEYMKTPEEYFDSLLSTDANCPVDVYAHKYNRADLFRFAEAYYKDQLKEQDEKEIYYREAWECPRCGQINSYLKLTCDCRPKGMTSTTY